MPLRYPGSELCWLSSSNNQLDINTTMPAVKQNNIAFKVFYFFCWFRAKGMSPVSFPFSWQLNQGGRFLGI